jgi:hypothetical protein
MKRHANLLMPVGILIVVLSSVAQITLGLSNEFKVQLHKKLR